MSNSSIWLMDRTISGATTLGQSGAESDGNEKVHGIPQSSSIMGVSPSDSSMSNPGHSLVCVWRGGLTPQQGCSQCILLPQPTGLCCHFVQRNLLIWDFKWVSGILTLSGDIFKANSVAKAAFSFSLIQKCLGSVDLIVDWVLWHINPCRLLLWPWKELLIKTQTQILDNRLYYTRKIELHRKDKKSRTVRITPILICLW